MPVSGKAEEDKVPPWAQGDAQFARPPLQASEMSDRGAEQKKHGRGEGGTGWSMLGTAH